MRLAHVSRQLFVVVAQFREHIKGRDVVSLIVEHTLQPADVPD